MAKSKKKVSGDDAAGAKPKAKKGDKVPANDVAQQRQALKEIGLRIKKIEEDGNCLFRAIADQLWGDQERHEEVRQKTVEYIESNRAHFEWFCEEDEPIDAYCARLRKAGEWGGNMEVVAASGHWKIGIAIHQADTPCYVVCEDDVRSGSRGGGRKTLHLSLHDGASDGFAHYNSVRMMSEGDDGPSRISIQGVQGDGDSLQHEDALASDAANVTVVMRGSGCTDELRAKQMLASLDGDVDAAIEAIIAGCELGPQTDEPRGQGDAERAGEGDGHRQAGDDEDPASPGREDDGSDAGAGGGSGSGEGGGGVATGHVKTKMQQKREAKAAKAAAKRAEKRERVLGRGTPDPDEIPPPSEADHLRAGGHTLANGIRVLSI